jgi:hypothetical protein
LPGRPRPLADFAPYWLPAEKGVRENVGLGFTCPVHKDHPVAFYFRHPLDGSAPQPLTRLYEVEGFLDGSDVPSFDDITVCAWFGDERPLVASCGAAFWLIGGEVFLKRR